MPLSNEEADGETTSKGMTWAPEVARASFDLLLIELWVQVSHVHYMSHMNNHTGRVSTMIEISGRLTLRARSSSTICLPMLPAPHIAKDLYPRLVMLDLAPHLEILGIEESGQEDIAMKSASSLSLER
jgi:hypothetical protein